MGPVGIGHQELVPPAWGVLNDCSTVLRAERWGLTSHSLKSRETALESSVQALAPGLLSFIVVISWEVGQQLLAQGPKDHWSGLTSKSKPGTAKGPKGVLKQGRADPVTGAGEPYL